MRHIERRMMSGEEARTAVERPIIFVLAEVELVHRFRGVPRRQMR
jgi:hypothetical protein